jgi:hypothetical protein
MQWLKDEARPIDAEARRALAAQLESTGPVMRGRPLANLAVRLNHVVIHNTKKWFGDAEIRLDVLVVHGANPDASDGEFFKPTTLRFERIRDGDALPIGDGGVLIFYGRPKHFIDISITASRNRQDTEDLSKLLAERAKNDDFKSSAAVILGMTAVAPQAAAVVAGVEAASSLANTAAEVLLKATNGTIGVYHTSYLQYRDRFGLGRHPEAGAFAIQDFSLAYEVVVDERARPPARA